MRAVGGESSRCGGGGLKYAQTQRQQQQQQTRQVAAAADAMLPTKKLCSKLNEKVARGESKRVRRKGSRRSCSRVGVIKANYKFLS